jgi:tripartite-type tricarboxylate transporter receptor subunit TctC
MKSALPVRGLLLASLLALAASAAMAQWKPTKPITLIVPWAPGGSTDQVTRVTAAELEKHLGQKIVIMNQPGASGSVGTKNAMEAPKDGYTWTAGGAKDLGTYKVLGMLDTSAKDWNLYLNVAHIAVVGVNADTPYKTMKEAAGRHEGQAWTDFRGNRWRQLQRPFRHRSHCTGSRRDLQARHL